MEKVENMEKIEKFFIKLRKTEYIYLSNYSQIDHIIK